MWTGCENVVLEHVGDALAKSHVDGIYKARWWQDGSRIWLFQVLIQDLLIRRMYTWPWICNGTLGPRAIREKFKEVLMVHKNSEWGCCSEASISNVKCRVGSGCHKIVAGLTLNLAYWMLSPWAYLEEHCEGVSNDTKSSYEPPVEIGEAKKLL